jgi:type II secretory pathway predicted ATPase ExeA
LPLLSFSPRTCPRRHDLGNVQFLTFAPRITDDAAGLIHQASRGFPRAVNRLAAAALLATCTTHKTIADTTAVRAAITEVNDQ